MCSHHGRCSSHFSELFLGKKIVCSAAGMNGRRALCMMLRVPKYFDYEEYHETLDSHWEFASSGSSQWLASNLFGSRSERARAVWPPFQNLRRFRLGPCCECSGRLKQIQTGNATRFRLQGEVRAGSRSFIVGAHPHGIFPFTAVCAAAWAPLAKDMRA